MLSQSNNKKEQIKYISTTFESNKPVSVFRKQISLNSIHEVVKELIHGGLLFDRLLGYDTLPELIEVVFIKENQAQQWSGH